LYFIIHAKQPGKSVHFAAAKIRILADQIEAHLSGRTNWHPERKELCAIQIGLNAVFREPTEAEAASNCIDRSFNGAHGQESLRRTARLALAAARTRSFNDYEDVLHHVDPRDLSFERMEWVIPVGDRCHLDIKDRLHEIFARHQPNYAEMRIVRRKLRISGNKGGLAEFLMDIWKLPREFRKSGKEALIREDAIHRQSNLRLSARREQASPLLELMESCQMGFGISQQNTPSFRQMGFPALLLKQLYPNLFLESRDGIADCRLRAIELLCGRREAAELNNSLENFPFIEGCFHYDQYI